MGARRCTRCALDWPLSDEYKECPSCEEPTRPFRNIKPMHPDEAASEAKHYRFERFYEKWDETHPPERLDTALISERLLAPEPAIVHDSESA